MKNNNNLLSPSIVSEDEISTEIDESSTDSSDSDSENEIAEIIAEHQDLLNDELYDFSLEELQAMLGNNVATNGNPLENLITGNQQGEEEEIQSPPSTPKTSAKRPFDFEPMSPNKRNRNNDDEGHSL